MIKFAKIIDEKIGNVIVGLGEDKEYYISLGFSQMDVKQSDIDECWYLATKCPMKTKEQKELEREESFKNNFFKIKDACWFRKQPKGYNSAIESLNTAFNVVSVLGKLPANTLTFYIAPDFSIEEQCTENWLVKNSYKNEEMTPQEFSEFYASFMTAWNNEEHK